MGGPKSAPSRAYRARGRRLRACGEEAARDASLRARLAHDAGDVHGQIAHLELAH